VRMASLSRVHALFIVICVACYYAIMYYAPTKDKNFINIVILCIIMFIHRITKFSENNNRDYWKRILVAIFTIAFINIIISNNISNNISNRQFTFQLFARNTLRTAFLVGVLYCIICIIVYIADNAPSVKRYENKIRYSGKNIKEARYVSNDGRWHTNLY